MIQVCDNKEAVLLRISPIVDRLLQSDSFFKEKLDKEEILHIFSNLLDRLSPEELLALDEEQLKKRVDRVIATEAMSRLLDNLTPEEIEIFDAAVAGR